MKAKGFAGVTVACEPTGHRWRVLGQLAEQRGMSFVCVQPMLTSWARRSEDLTFDKTDEKDAVPRRHLLPLSPAGDTFHPWSNGSASSLFDRD